MKIGFIGSSEISRFHVEALRHNGFDIESVGTRISSKNCKDFAIGILILSSYPRHMQ